MVDFFAASDERLQDWLRTIDSDARESAVRELDAAITLGFPRVESVLLGWYARSVWYGATSDGVRAGALARMLGYEMKRVYEVDPIEVLARLDETDESALPVASLVAASLIAQGRSLSEREGPAPVHPDTVWKNPQPTRHVYRNVGFCPSCDTDTVHDRWEVHLPTLRQGLRTLFTGTKREASQWETCSGCGQLTPEDAAASRLVNAMANA